MRPVRRDKGEKQKQWTNGLIKVEYLLHLHKVRLTAIISTRLRFDGPIDLEPSLNYLNFNSRFSTVRTTRDFI